ncbi:MAG: hypothetical protein F6J90_38235 [Moorea sp. SIOASIH]|uniref:hypothetical protein n=1 Tax=Moorena sp. SIOASIH TaxID=2607817 RepID=UPI0013BCBDAF|nr:hypothetical protein [Moorena sp. SIOASIH]NEO41852.1 hypothetical protein [Moorena sp. SIOASIH]
MPIPPRCPFHLTLKIIPLLAGFFTCSLFPIPYSLFPIPCSLLPKTQEFVPDPIENPCKTISPFLVISVTWSRGLGILEDSSCPQHA